MNLEQGNRKFYLNRRLYYEFSEKGELKALSFFLLLCMKCDHRAFNSMNIPVKKTSFYKYLKTLSSAGLIEIRDVNGSNKTHYTLASSKKINALFPVKNEKRVLYIPYGEFGFIHQFLKSIPALSNLTSQNKMKQHKEYLCDLKARSESAPSTLTPKERKVFLKAHKLESSGVSLNPDPLVMTVKRFSELTGYSFSTASKIRSNMLKSGGYHVKNSCTNIKNVNRYQYEMMVNDGNIPDYSFYKMKGKDTGTVFFRNPSEFFVL